MNATESMRLWRTSNGLERVFCTLHEDFEGCGRVVFIATCSGPRDLDAIRKALCQVWQECPTAAIVPHRLPSGDYEFRIPYESRCPVVEVLSVAEIDAGYQFAVELGRRPHPSPEPVLRWVVLTSEADERFQIIGLANHGLFDGAAMMLLLRRFLTICGAVTSSEWLWRDPVFPRGRWRTWWRSLSLAFRHWCQHYRYRLRDCCSLPRDADDGGRCVVHRWTEAETIALTTVCHAAGVTVTAILGVAGAEAVARVYGARFENVDVVFPIDNRRYLLPAEAERATGMSTVGLTFQVRQDSQKSLAEKATPITQTLRDFIENEVPLRWLSLCRELMPLKVKPDRSRPLSVSANSLGKVTLPTSPSGIVVKEIGWFANGSVHMPAFSQASATVDGRFAVTSYSTWIGRARLESLAAETDRMLRQFAGLTAG